MSLWCQGLKVPTKANMKVTHLNPSLRLPWLGEVELKEVVMFAVRGNSARLQVHSHLQEYIFAQMFPK